MPKRKLGAVAHSRLSDVDYHALRRAAEQRQVSVSTYLRRLVRRDLSQAGLLPSEQAGGGSDATD